MDLGDMRHEWRLSCHIQDRYILFARYVRVLNCL